MADSAPKNRKAAQDFILKYIDKILPTGENKAIYETMFSNMDDKQFDVFMKNLQDGTQRLAVVSPNFNKARIDLKRNFTIAKELGHEFFQRVWIPAKDGNRAYLSPIPYLIVSLPLRRQAQLLSKKVSIPEDNNSVDDFTGQPTGKSKGAKVSYPEVQVLASMGLDKSIEELMKYRGGDEKGFNSMNTMIDRTGQVDLKTIAPYTSGVKSTLTLKTYLLAAHLGNTL
jgi:hypothetical protein